MRKLLLTYIFIILVLFSKATTYYFSTSTGNDSNTPLQAQSPSSPWKSINKLNSFAPFLTEGDVICFWTGETYYGALPTKAGITFTSFGSGAKPVISGMTAISNWVSLGGNMWESSITIPSSPNVLLINNTPIPKGRYPDSGWLNFESHSGTSSITDNQLTATPNWTGGDVVIRKHWYMVDVTDVTAHNNTTLSLSGGGNGDEPWDGFGYYIQDHPSTLTINNEWVYMLSSQKIRIYSTTIPPLVEVSTIETLATPAASSVYNNLSFKGSNSHTIVINNVSGASVTNCDILCSGRNGIQSSNSNNLLIANNLINYSSRSGIEIPSAYNTTIKDNKILNTGLNPGGIGRGKTNEAMRGIWVVAGNSGYSTLVQGNIIDSVGYNGIEWQGWNVTIKNNLINHYCNILSDGAGIYTYNGTGNTSAYQTASRIIDGNIILNGILNLSGATGNGGDVYGIYLDNQTNHVTVINNTSANNTGGAGMLCNDNNYIIIKGNTFFNNKNTQFSLNNMQQPPSNNIEFKNNILYAKTSIDRCFKAGDVASQSMAAIFSSGMDYNFIARPIKDDDVFYYYIYASKPPITNPTLEQWRTATGLDLNTKKAPKTISSTNDLRFEYNASYSTVTIPLGANYVTPQGNVIASLTLPPYSSSILIYHSPSTPLPTKTLSATYNSGVVDISWTDTLSILQISYDGITWTSIPATHSYTPTSVGKLYIKSPLYPAISLNIPAIGIYYYSGYVYFTAASAGQYNIIRLSTGRIVASGNYYKGANKIRISLKSGNYALNAIGVFTLKFTK